MNNKVKNNSGITLVALIITIIVMMIIASISVNEGTKIIKKSKAQTTETNMLVIEAKSKAYAEEIESLIWTKSGTEKDDERTSKFSEKKMQVTSVTSEALNQVASNIQSDYVAYKVTSEALSDMGLDIDNEEYIVIFSKSDYKLMDVIYTAGINYNNKIHYSLSSLRESLENE